MTVEPCGDHIVLTPHTDDELELVAGIVEAIRVGGSIQVNSSTVSTRLSFDGDPSQKKPKRLKPSKLKELSTHTHGCHDCGEERPPRIIRGGLTCPECGSENLVCID
jgi:Zn finger protein HypA/HybF involved in hydrogenase expression